MSETRYALQIVHGYNEPFFSLSNSYTRALQQSGYQVTSVFLTGEYNDAIFQNSTSEETLFLNLSTRLLKGLKLKAIFQIKAVFDQRPYQLIVGQRYKPVYIASILAMLKPSVKVLGVAHAFGFLNGRGRQHFLSWLGNRLHLLAVSSALAEDMKNVNKRGVSISVLHNCIDMNAIEPKLIDRETARTHLSIEEKTFVFANVGRLHPDKDQATLIRAFASFVEHAPNARLILIGTGSLESDLRQLINELGMSKFIRLTGKIDQAYRYFKAFDAYVSTSVKESFGIVLAEAMMAKIPVISTDSGGASEVLCGNADFFVAGDEVNLSQLLQQMVNKSQAERLEIGAKNYQSVQTHFSQQAFNKGLQDILDMLI